MTPDDTIVAISSAVRPAARMIVRLSGSAAISLARSLCRGLIPAPSTASSCRLRLSILSRPVELPITVYTFVTPHSYTGEDLVELHVPGNPLLCKLLLDALIAGGARLAEPGEFTARAYFHGRIDLTEAEGVAATIHAQNEQELRAARQLMAGELANRLRPIMDSIAQALAWLEVGIDFTDEDVTFIDVKDVNHRATEADAQLSRLLGESARFERLSHEPRVVLVGRPNAGKSTLINALARRERAIVSPIAGTTRDALSVEVALARGIITLVDLAGVEAERAETTGAISDPIAVIERSMREMALREVKRADHVVLVREAGCAQPAVALNRPLDLVLMTKLDLMSQAKVGDGSSIAVSVKTGANMDALRDRLDAMVFGPTGGGGGLAINLRHERAIMAAREALRRVMDATAHSVAVGAELLAADLRDCLDSLGQILGSISPDDLLGRIFSTFCIGK